MKVILQTVIIFTTKLSLVMNFDASKFKPTPKQVIHTQ